MLEGRESGQPLFPSFYRNLLKQGLPTSDFSATSPPPAFVAPSPLTSMLPVTWIPLGTIHNRFQGKNGVEVFLMVGCSALLRRGSLPADKCYLQQKALRF